MKNYKYFPHILLLALNLFGVIWQVQSACEITGPYNLNLIFDGYTNETKLVTLTGDSFTSSCSFTCYGPSDYLTLTKIGTNVLQVKLGDRRLYPGSYNGSITIFSSASASIQLSISYTIPASLQPGAISSSTNEIGSNMSPGLLRSDSPASGGDGSLKYQWLLSTNDGAVWSEIPNANGESYNCPNLGVTTSFKRRVTRLTSGLTADSNILTISVGFTGGTIGCNTSFAIQNTSPGTFYSSTLPQGGNGSYTYQWQSYSNAGPWTDITASNSATNSTDYNCPPLSVNTAFRRKVTSGSAIAYSNELSLLLINASNNENYIVSLSPQIASTSESSLLALSLSNLTPTIQYLDGLGRTKQTISIGASPSGKDIVQPIIYDELGREQYKLLPYVCSSNTNLGAFRINPVKPDDPSEQKSFYTNATNESQGLVYDAYPYAKTIFEPSPLSRVLQQGAPGADWQPTNAVIPNSGHVQEVGYQTNVINEVLRFTITGNALSPIIGNYAANELYVTQRTDEDKHISKEYKDQEGQVVMKRVLDGTDNLDTYYVYDDFGLLRFVLPPEAIDKINKVRSTTPPASGSVANITASITKNVYENTSYVVSTGSTLTLGNGFRFYATPGTSFSVTSSGQLSQSDQYNLVYQYQYDERKRMTVKKIPGADEVFMVYDDRDRLVLTQDGKMRAEDNKQWNFIKYDQLNRPVLSGIYIHPQDQTQEQMREQMQAFVNSTIYPKNSGARAFYVTRDNSVAITGYTDVSFPMANDGVKTYLTATYYDTYDFPGCATGLTTDAIITTGTTNFTRLNGLVTGSKELVLKTSTDLTRTYLTTTNYYDDHYRVIQSKRDLYDGNAVSSSSELVSNKYDFVGKVTQTRQVQTFKAVTTAVDKNLYYDHAGRLIKTDMALNNSSIGVTVSELAYNEIGQLIDKKLHKSSTGVFNQSVDFKYNIRGWLTGINDPSDLSVQVATGGDPSADLFAESILYNKLGNDRLKNSKLYNGNISGQIWNSNGKMQSYCYAYDGLNRITEGDYAVIDKTYIWYWDNSTSYEEKVNKYDFNGNIKTLTRTDNLGGTAGINGAAFSYNYNGNQLLNLNGGANYGYDANGNMTIDGRTGNAFAYNMLNLPQKVSKGSDNINYTYSATGQKLLKNYNGTSNQYYAGNMVYSNANALDYIIFEEGVIRKTSTGFSFEYNLKDHLGNTRAVFSAGGSAPTLVQTSDYYPFGQTFAPMQVNNTANKYLYNGKELQDDKLAGSSLNMLDYGARFYDAGIGRWGCVDPRTEDDYSSSPYVYVAGNPVINIDPDGEFLFTTIGAIVGATTAAVKGGDWTEIGKAAVAGAVAGAVIDVTVATGGAGAAVFIAAGAVSGMAGEATSQVLHGQSNVGDILMAGAFGASMGMIGEMAGPLFRTTKGLFRNASVEAEALSPGTILDDAAAGSGTPRVKTTKQLRSEWEATNGETWPKDATTGKNKVAHHRKPLADGGADNGGNITPLTHKEHIQHHKANGDFKRWGNRSKRN